MLPGQDYIMHILNIQEVDNLNGLCLIQLNLSKAPKKFLVNALSAKNDLYFDVSYLDEDGKLYSEISDLTKKIFLLGNTQGVASIEVESIDGSKDLFHSYCSLETYLIEQL